MMPCFFFNFIHIGADFMNFKASLVYCLFPSDDRKILLPLVFALGYLLVVFIMLLSTDLSLK